MVAVVSFAIAASTAAYAGDESWMEDNAYAFRNNTLETLSLPGSHDAGMYDHDVGLIEIGVENLRARVQLSGVTLFQLPSTSGVIEGRELLAVFNGLMDVVRAVDRQCVYVPWPVDEEFCVEFGLEDLVWGWVGPYYELATGKPGGLSITQNLDLHGQLHSGVRMFDLRPKKQGGALYIHHSQANIDLAAPPLGYSLDLGFTVPCVEVPIVGGCVPGTGQHYGFGTFSVEAGGAVKSLSVTGPRLDEVLGDVRRYMEEGHRELVVLGFSHYWSGYNGSSFSAADYDQLLGMVTTQLGPWLLKGRMLSGECGMTSEERLVDATLGHLVGSNGRVLVALEQGNDYPYAYVDPTLGLWPSSVLAASGGYANKEDLDAMRADQLDKWMQASGARFNLWWTLTCQQGSIDCNVRDLASEANPHLPAFVDGLTIPNANGNNVNAIWVDFSDETDATQLAIRLNPLAVDLDPGKVRLSLNPRRGDGVRIALLSDPGMPLDALHVDMQTVRFGPDRARVIGHDVKDVNRDGRADLVLHFAVPDAGIQCGDSVVRLTGRTFSDQGIIGKVSIHAVDCDDRRRAQSHCTPSGNIADQDSEWRP